jgi:sn-glycerol 3-phosphate transport system substrate-binding protein
MLKAVVVAVVVLLSGGPALAQTEITFWHAMGGALGEKTKEIAEAFNKTQNEYRVNAIYKGNYTETMTAAIAAFRARQQPHVVQVFEVGTATMMAAKGAVKPVHELMTEAGGKFDAGAYIPAVTGYYTTPDGKMLSLPFNSSTPVLYYNKDAFKKAGLDPARPPRTWPEVGEAGKKLQASGLACGFTTDWQSWIQLENLSAWHNVPFATKANGFGGLDTELRFNSPLHVKHIAQIAEWQKTKLFDYGGRRNEATAKFTNAECGMLTESSAGYASVKRTSKFDFGIAPLPYWPDAQGAPQNTIIGGASLWAMAGHSPQVYRGVARFFTYLSSPEVQAEWHQFSGYLPITRAAYELTRKQGFYDKNPGTDVSIQQMTGKTPTENSKGLRLGNMAQIRDVIDEELEAVWAGRKSAKDGLDTAVRRGNELLRQFERANK